MHKFGMDLPIPQLLKHMMDALPGNQTALAKRLSQKGPKGLKISQAQVSRWIKGQEPERPRYDRIIEVAQELHVLNDLRSEDVANGLPSPMTGPTVKLKGYVGAGSEAHYYNLSDEDFEDVPAPIGASSTTIALELKGKSLGPLFESWLVYYDDVRSPVTEDLYGLMCVVGLPDDKILVKRIMPDRKGTFTLMSNGTDPDITGARIMWAAKVTDLKPR